MELVVRSFDSEKIEKVAEILKAIAHPARLQIIGLLEQNSPQSVSDILENINIEASVLSHHLIKMKDKGLLSSRREGRNIFYKLKVKEITKIFDCMEACHF